jgi:hypothetical protein
MDFSMTSIESIPDEIKMLMIEKLREPMVQDATAWHQEVEQPTVVLPLRSLL